MSRFSRMICTMRITESAFAISLIAATLPSNLVSSATRIQELFGGLHRQVAGGLLWRGDMALEDTHLLRDVNHPPVGLVTGQHLVFLDALRQVVLD